MAVQVAPLGRRVEVDGREIWAHEAGSGGPAVVFLPGAAAVGLDYLNLFTQVSEFTTAVIYDRGGTGWSDRTELPRTAASVATDLRDLLVAAGVEGPYVLVAHSLGGAHARRFAQLFPELTAGLVLLEPFYENWDDYMPERLKLAAATGKEPGRLLEVLTKVFGRKVYANLYASWPAEIREPLIRAHLSSDWIRISVRERSNMPELATELRDGGPVPDVPMIVMTALDVDPGQAVFMSKKTVHTLSERKVAMYQALADATSRGEHRTVSGAGHSNITVMGADAVLTAIRDVVLQAKSGRSV
jgi:pimeloyl-ACP methyl ester carboxylesterase